jgi:hypothetical protein
MKTKTKAEPVYSTIPWNKGWPKSPKLKYFYAVKKSKYRDERGRYYSGKPEFRFRAFTFAHAREIVAEKTNGEGTYRIWRKNPTTMTMRRRGGYLRVDEKIFPITSAIQRLIDTGRTPKILSNLGGEVEDAIQSLLQAVGLYRYVKNNNAGGFLGSYQTSGCGQEINPRRWDLIFVVMKAKGLLKDRWRQIGPEEE